MRNLFLAVVCFAASSSIAKAEDFSEVVKAVRNSVVRVEVSGPEGETLGSGFVVRDDGVIATNFHVIDSASRGKVVFEDGRSMEIIGMLVERRDHDMVLLKVESAQKLPVLPLCQALPEQGEDAVSYTHLTLPTIYSV